MVDRMIRAAKADIELYEEVEHSPSLTKEAYTIVGIVAVISAIGSIIASLISGEGPIWASVSLGVTVFLGYFVWSYLTFFIGTKAFNGTADYGELQRTIGYAMTPQVLSFIPLLNIVTGLWSIYLGFVAVRQALDIDNTKALLTVVISFLPMMIIVGVLSSFLVGG